MSAEPLSPTSRNASLSPAGANGQGAPRGGVYLLHFEQRYEHAGHYTGHADDFDNRVAEQASGDSRAARLLQVIAQAGIGFRLARVWPGASKGYERSLKNSGGASRYCPVCQDERKARGDPRRPPRNGDRHADPAGRAVSAPPERYHRQPVPAVPTRGVRPQQAREFMALNPAFARPVSASLAKQWGRVRGREEIEALTPRVTSARFEENELLSQQRAGGVTKRAVQARVLARQQQLADRAEQIRAQAIAARTHQRLAAERSPQRPHRRDRNQSTSGREGGHER